MRIRRLALLSGAIAAVLAAVKIKKAKDEADAEAESPPAPGSTSAEGQTS